MSSQKEQIKLLLSAIQVEQLELPLSASLDKIAVMFLAPKNQSEGRQLISKFLLEYAIATPGFLVTINETSKNLALSSAVGAPLAVASRFLDETLTKKLPIINSEDPPLLLLTLLHACYFVNRVIEEIDDKVESFIRLPLSPINLMYSNIIIHEVIGDRFANRLDLNLTKLINPSGITKALLEANLGNVQIETQRTAGLCLSGDKVCCFAQSQGLSLA
ncbi:MAG: hypothetical protein ACJAVI_005716 [Candidatus Azotimanducaceae bacterium]|jgi:hypothetical protein